MTERPRPQYGEYASPEDQAKAMGLPLPPAGKPVSVPPPPVAGTASAVSTAPTQPPPPPTPTPPSTRASAPSKPDPTHSDFTASGIRAPRRWDLVLSLVLIVYGGMIVFSGFASGPTLAPQMSEIYSRMGLGTYTATALAGSLGRIVNFVSAILFVITLIVTGTLLRRGHIAFYVPLIAGIISTIFAAACLVALLAQDPGALSRIGG